MRDKYLWVVLSVAVATIAVVVAVFAGNPDSPPGPPESTLSYTLEDIYQRLDSGAAGTPVTFTEPISGPATGTMHTLDDIMGVAPAVDDTNGATQAQMLAGKTAWGLTNAEWGVMTGTMPDNGAVNYAPSTITQAIAMGYHDGSGKVVGDADLVAGNVRSGANIFGVSGDPNVVDTSSGDATAVDIVWGKKAWVDGVELTGSGVITPAYPAPVPKTGQTDCYKSASPWGTCICGGADCPSGQDGHLEMGVVWPSPRFITSTTGIVTDTLTGLVWLQDADCLGYRPWADALTQIGNLNSGTDFSCDNYTAGTFGDWRLPNVRELQSLVDYGQHDPALPTGHPFTGVQSYHYWSSTTYAGSTAVAWNVYLDDGLVLAYDKAIAFYVWPVRGGQ